jgi:hypothetical protein
MNASDPVQTIRAIPVPALAPARGQTPGDAPAQASTDEGSGGFLHHLWQVIDPLEHLPLISTLYRAVTGEHIGTLERIAGDGLYGGLWGAISAIADTAFEAVTGRDFGSTVLALFGQPAAKAATPQAAADAPAAGRPGDGTAGQAIVAYRKAMALTAGTAL